LITEKLYNIERLRTLAIIGIVWFHTDGLPCRGVGYAGLPVFILIFFMLIGMKGYEANRVFIKKKFDRLILPWLFWSVVYLGYQVGKYLIKKQVSLEPYMLITGPATHLWYLSWAFTLAVVANAMQKRITARNEKCIIWMTILASVGLSVGIPLLANNLDIKPPLAQWFYGLAACPAGWLIGKQLSNGKDEKSKVKIFRFCLIISLICLLMTVLGFGYLGLSYIVGFIIYGLAVCLPNWNAKDILSRWAPLTFGIYLIHPLAGGITEFVTPVIASNAYAKAVVVVFLSALATWAIAQVKPLARFI
jgi:surface polysaccharide O-acyltransferase-like enzyme